MAFAFNLGGDDIDLDEDDLQESSSVQDAQPPEQDRSAPPVRTYLLNCNGSQDISTRSLLECLPSSISYESVELSQRAPRQQEVWIPEGGMYSEESRSHEEQPQYPLSVLRRPTYDILLQLKAEADPETNKNAELISAMEGNDRQSGVYEGGLKTWEGALDLADLVMDLSFVQQSGNWHIVEMGAGSAIPSIVALKNILDVNSDADLYANRRRFHFTLADYNDEVLRLSTFANVLLASKEELERRQRRQVPSPLIESDSLDVNEDLIRECRKLWQQAGVSFNFVSGPWGKEFEDATTVSNLASDVNGCMLILASETIYDLKSLPTFTDTVINLLRVHVGYSRAWVAAKILYFGVGGGVDAFIQEVKTRGGAVREIMNVKEGVSRVVLEVTYQENSAADTDRRARMIQESTF